MNGLMGLLGNCRVMCWIVSALFGILALVFFNVTLGWHFLLALLLGVLAAGAAAYFLPTWFCTADATAAPLAGSASALQGDTADDVKTSDKSDAPTDAGKGAASDDVADSASKTNTSEDEVARDEIGNDDTAASASQTSEPSEPSADEGVDEAPTEDQPVASETQDDQAESDALSVEDETDQVSAASVDASTAADDKDASAVVSTGTLLPGEEDIAHRKGEWRYEGKASEGEAASSDAATTDASGASSDSAADKAQDPADETTAESDDHDIPDLDNDGVLEGRNEGEKPETLSAARDGKPDNLKEIKGVGPKMERMLNELGFYHFDQIAKWTDQQVAWVDANLEGFKGRVSRDEWVAQAKILATGAETDFSKRVDRGDVY
ncbi:hypothetical protein [Halovulum sp. GXIMD14793]